MQKRYLTPNPQNTHMTERYRLVAAVVEAAPAPAPKSTRRATVAGMPTTPAWYGAAKPKATVK